MRIIFVIGTLDLGGAERHLASVLPMLLQRGIEPAVFSLAGKGELSFDLEVAGIPVRTVWLLPFLKRLPRVLRRLVGLPLSMLSLLSCIRSFRPQAIHMFLPAAYLVGSVAAIVFRIPVKIMSRRSRNDYQRKFPLLRQFESLLHRRMSALLANSQPVFVDLLGERADVKRVRMLYNGISPMPHINKFEARGGLAEFGVRRETFVMTVTANLISYKGHQDLLNALALLKAELPQDWILLCVGEDRGIGEQMKVHASQSGIGSHVHWLGLRRDVANILAASDVGILSSHEEGFSNAVLEYMAVGLPSVVTDVGGNSEAVIDGVCGFVVPPRDSAALAAALRRLAHNADLRATMGEAARERIQRDFDIDTCVAKYALLYEALARGGELPALDSRLPAATDPASAPAP